MSVPNIVRSADAVAEAESLGGKGANLAALGRIGVRVPPWFCLTARAPEAGLSVVDERQLLEEFDRAFPPGAFVAVRSSAVSEDSASDSFAGQLETFLFVHRPSLCGRVRACLASAASERVRAYRAARGLPATEVRVAVVVQLMIDSRVSGVLFTANPTSGDTGEAILAAGMGLGEGVVADRVETDTFYADLATGAVRHREVSLKRTCLVFDRAKGGGTTTEAVPPELADRPALDDGQVREIVSIGRRVAEEFGAPQDVEWAIDGVGGVFLLQARPITSLEGEQIFDNSNIVESYPGVTLPLTFSFARASYEETFREASRGFGVSEAVLREKRPVHANLLATIEGRIYYDLLHWYALFEMLPGFEAMLPAWEKALGLPRRHVRPARRTWWDRLLRVPRRVRFLVRLAWLLATLRRRARRFGRTFDDLHEEFRRHPRDKAGAMELVVLYERLAARLLPAFSVTVLNDFFAQQSYQKLEEAIRAWELGDPSSLRNDLLCGEKGMESVEPVRSAMRLAETIRRNPRLIAALDAPGGDAAAWQALLADDEVGGLLKQHLDRYGDRTVQELKLETPLLEDEPGFLLATLRNLVKGGSDVSTLEAREKEIRAGAEAQVRARMKGHPVRRVLFDLLLRCTRMAVRQREDLRLTRSRAFGIVKRIFRRIGAIFAERGLLQDPLDVFYLTVEELLGVVRAHSVTRALDGLVAIRKQEYEAFRGRNPPSRVTTRGLPCHDTPDAGVPVEEAKADVLRGLGCSPGKVTARAKVVLSADRGTAVHGEILVAPMTDPGWVFLMVTAGGLVVERGSVLSHTAIIGRELGIPTVVGVRDATRRVRDGQLIEIDGRAGTVRVLDDQSARA